jgi:hypothetical protein
MRAKYSLFLKQRIILTQTFFFLQYFYYCNVAANSTYCFGVVMQELNMVEVEEVSGALGPVAVGAVAGGVWGGYQYFAASGSATWGGAALAIGSGVFGGAVAGMGGFSFAFYGGGLSAVGGMSASTFMKPNAAR